MVQAGVKAMLIGLILVFSLELAVGLSAWMAGHRLTMNPMMAVGCVLIVLGAFLQLIAWKGGAP